MGHFDGIYSNHREFSGNSLKRAPATSSNTLSEMICLFDKFLIGIRTTGPFRPAIKTIPELPKGNCISLIVWSSISAHDLMQDSNRSPASITGDKTILRISSHPKYPHQKNWKQSLTYDIHNTVGIHQRSRCEGLQKPNQIRSMLNAHLFNL